MKDVIARVRAFNRFYTNVIGVLSEGLLDSPYSLTEARLIFELAQRDSTEVAALRHDLAIDAGYLSRLLAKFETDGLITRARSATDGRRQVIRLTPAGRAVYDTLDERSAGEVRGLLTPLTDERRRRLVAAMDTIEEVLAGPRRPRAYVLRPPRPGDFGWVVHRHGVLYAQEYGWDATFEALVARVVAGYIDEHDARRENAWIAEVAGEPVGCVFCVRRDDTTAQLRLLLVEPSCRGTGIGTRLVDECLTFARLAGYKSIMLWTNDVLGDARRVYERAGFRLAEQGAHHSFGHDLVEQIWRRDL
ncbi:MAG TPA: helix-turn-helix domain-containing GNAT family N-acetyltransferase [Streptosporangiaceae bacterium]|nr:helix-turn-helix domain-containing GNAT family N-acetyltransferase [Streptosporangiaceae bacterium]